jgi:hypothetical protein
MRSLTGPKPGDVTRMSESGRLPSRAFRPRWAESFGDLLVARAVHVVAAVLMSAAMTACVVPPPLEVDETDAGLNSPPTITTFRDPALAFLRPPATLTVNTTGGELLQVSVFDLDLDDELVVRMFVDSDGATDPPLVTCIAPAPSLEATRPISCPTTNLCQTAGLHLLEIEAYDSPPLINAPYRASPGEFFSNWTFDLNCVDPS